MKTLYIDCGMGAAGDMLTAALLELFPDSDHLIEELNALGIPHVHFSKEPTKKCGISGTHVTVKVHGEEEGDCMEHHHHHGHSHHSHHTLHEIEHLLSHLQISEKVRLDVQKVYTLIAAAESQVHGVPVSEIHFHEVGNLDAIADITAFCFLMEKLSPDKVVSSPIHVGSGQVRCAHGILPVPAPATVLILKDCPIYSGTILGELCTPTGAALLKHFADEFGNMPLMKTHAIGYGMGKKDFEAANCVRAFWGETADEKDFMYELRCNVDDMTAEQIGYALEYFLSAGAVDAFAIPVTMKKSRPGTLIELLCSEEKKEQVIHALFKHTTTSGIRETKVQRRVLNRTLTEVSTPYGMIHRKDYWGYGVSRSKYEHDELAAIAQKENLSILEVLENIKG